MRIPTWMESKDKNHYPFLRKNDAVFHCPFAEAGSLEVYDLCVNDLSHRER